MSLSLASTSRVTAARRRPVRLSLLIAIWFERRALSRMSDSALRDIGVSREAARAEANRPLWDIPVHRR